MGQITAKSHLVIGVIPLIPVIRVSNLFVSAFSRRYLEMEQKKRGERRGNNLCVDSAKTIVIWARWQMDLEGCCLAHAYAYWCQKSVQWRNDW